MKNLVFSFLLIVTLNVGVAFGQSIVNSVPCKPCSALRELRIPEVSFLKIESFTSDTIPASELTPPVIIGVPFCRVIGRISNNIEFELFLPQQWNGRFLMSGNGGFAGSFQNMLRPYVNGGYAVVSTDTGHKGFSELAADWALNNMEAQLNFGHLAVHRTAVVSKHILRESYCGEPVHSYFIGCSRGGGQALMEAQRYPEDFDGIVAGAPAFSWPATGAKAIKECQTNYPDPKNSSEPIITADNLKLLQEIVLRQCDKIDGLNDNILNEPSKCRIDFTKLPICQGEISGKDCFTKNQLVAIRAIYDPLTVNDKQIYPGFPFGLEAELGGMDLWITGTSPFLKPSVHNYFGQGIFKYLVFNDPNWDYTKYDFQDFFQETKYASSYLDATNIDYTGLKKRKGKMIVFHGWNDPAVSAYSTVQHYEGAMKMDKDLQSYIRLFLLPGVLHCAGGRGPDSIDWVKLIQDWVEKGNAPERVIFSKIVDGKVAMTRPVYPYPKVATYSGKGDANQESSFVLKDK